MPPTFGIQSEDETDVDRALKLNEMVEQLCRESSGAVAAYACRINDQPEMRELKGLTLNAAATAAARLKGLGPLRDGELTYFVQGILVNAFLGMFEAASMAARAAALLTPPAPEPAPVVHRGEQSPRRSGRVRAMLRRLSGAKG